MPPFSMMPALPDLGAAAAKTQPKQAQAQQSQGCRLGYGPGPGIGRGGRPDGKLIGIGCQKRKARPDTKESTVCNAHAGASNGRSINRRNSRDSGVQTERIHFARRHAGSATDAGPIRRPFENGGSGDKVFKGEGQAVRGRSTGVERLEAAGKGFQIGSGIEAEGERPTRPKRKDDGRIEAVVGR